MSINSTLKKEGIKVIKQLDTLEINKIASNISEKICSSFPEHNINQSDLFISIARLNMYIADMPNDSDIAKYFYKNNSIYFSKKMNFNDLSTLALHECLHFMQELKDKHGKLLKLGLHNIKQNNAGLAINEAAVQLMASHATDSKPDTVRYYNMDLTTPSPIFYPLQTAILSEMIYFTGSYPLFHSTLNSNDVFKNTFIAKSSPKTYSNIEYNLDLILHYEELLSETTQKLALCSDNENSISKLRTLNSKVNALKSIIFEKTLETQNIIINDCFNREFELIRNLDDIKDFQYKLYNFKHVLINAENYNFYNQFYCEMMNILDEKREYIKQYGILAQDNNFMTDLSELEAQTYGFKFFKNLFHKIKLLFEEKIRIKNL